MTQGFQIHKLLREPLLHFLIIGAGLFVLFNQVGDPEVGANNRIVITQTDLDRLAAVWLRRMGRPPTSQEREQQLDHFIREQVLYREALAMGLDQNDVIVRRRLAQKMEYLFNDLSLIPEPTEAELSSFLSENPEKFTVPASISFSQIYLDPTRRGQKVREDAKKLLTRLHAQKGITGDVTSKGDRSLLPYDYSEERENELANLFGKSFAAQLFALPMGSWQGPLTSEYGVHVVYVKSRREARLPPLDDIRARVSSEWRSVKERRANEIFYESLRQRYEIVLDDTIVKDALAGGEK